MEPKIIRKQEGSALSVLGDKQIVKLSSTDTSGQLTVIMQELPAGISVPMHVHANEDENFHIIEGEVEFQIGVEKFLLYPGDMIFLPRNIPHALCVLGEITAKVRINIVPAGIEDMFKELSSLPEGLPEMQHVEEICGRYGVRFL